MGLPVHYQWNPEHFTALLALPSVVVTRHLKMAGAVQLKVLLWLASEGKGEFDAQACGTAIGQAPADCTDALQYWLETGVLLTADGAAAQPAASVPTAQPAIPVVLPQTEIKAVPRPAAVKPQMQDVVRRQKDDAEFAYLLETASARLGRAITNGDMETLLYLYETAGLPAEVILMVIVYTVSMGKGHMRYIEKTALSWADNGIDTIDKAEQYLCRLDRRDQAWAGVQQALGLTHTPTTGQLDAVEHWVYDWHMNNELIRMAYEMCHEKTGKFQATYMSRILEHWHLDGIDTAEKARAALQKSSKGKAAPAAESSLDLDEYEELVLNYVPVYKKE